MHVSRSTKPFTNHSWQVWRSIYNNHIDVKIFPTMIWVHKEQAKLVNAQNHLYEGTRQNMLVTIHNNADQTFWIFYFLCVFRFLTQKQVKIDKKQNVKMFKVITNKTKKISNQARMITKSTQIINVTLNRKY